MRATDNANHVAEETFRVRVPPLSEQPDTLGLEQFETYEQMDTGGGSRAFANLSSGNLVWHAEPAVSRGRGLSTVVNATYNSQEEEQEVLPGALDDVLDPPTVGRGFSVGTSTLTRLNEPLEVTLAPLGGTVTLIDADGTRHRFSAAGDLPGCVSVEVNMCTAYTAPPGVDLHLRRYSDTDDPGQPLAGPQRAWAATRPDGVTHFFDSRGYQTSVADRHGNELSMRYEHRMLSGANAGPWSAGRCPLPADAGPFDEALCKQRLIAVVDAAGVDGSAPAGERTVALTYYDDTEGQLSPPAGYLKEIADQRPRTIAGVPATSRVTSFAYDSDGYLTSIVEAKGTAAERRFDLAWVDHPGPVPGVKELGSVTEPGRRDPGSGALDRRATSFTYDDEDRGGPLEPGVLPPRRASTLTNRAADATSITYGETTRNSLELDTARVTRPLSRATDHELEESGLLVRTTDPVGTVTDYGWDIDNHPTSVTTAVGQPEQSTVLTEYDSNGMLLRQAKHQEGTALSGFGDSNALVTNLSYVRSAEKHSLAPGDAGGEYVSDLTAIETPPGSATSTAGDHTYTFHVPNTTTGDVDAVVEPGGHTTTFDYSAKGELTLERDPAGDTALYEEHDPNGLPRRIRDERGNADPADSLHGCWINRYDGAGNLLSVTDPRGTSCDTAAPAITHTATFTYDALDRRLGTTVPKLSPTSSVTRTSEWDPNGNRIRATDGEGKATELRYTATDLPKTVTSPSALHFGEGAAASEVTELSYDAAERLVKRTAPEGARTATADDFATDYRYDAADRLVAEIRNSTASGESTLATSYAYDRRGNVVGLVDPRGNASAGGDPAANAQDETKRRFSYAYDAADNLRFVTEDPGAGGENDKRELRYDRNDNRTHEIDPRGTKSGATELDHTTITGYDERDLVSEVSRPGSTLGSSERSRTRFAYFADGLLESVTGPRGVATGDPDDFVTRFTYDAAGDLATRSLPRAPGQYGPAETKVSWRRNEVGDPVEITDARGHSFANTFYDTGQLRTTERPSWWRFDQASGAVVEQGPGGNADAGKEPERPEVGVEGDFGDVRPAPMPGVLPRAGAVTLTYDNEMRLTKVSVDGQSHETNAVYDALGRLTELDHPHDQAQRIKLGFAYDRNGNRRATTDGEGHRTELRYDQFDRVSEVHAPGQTGGGSEVTKLKLDANGNTLEVTTPGSTVWKYTHDLLDRRTVARDPEGEAWSFAYDAAGNRVCERSPRGNVGLSSPTCPTGGGAFTTVTQFNGRGEPTRISEPEGRVTDIAYDLNGNVRRVEEPGAASAPGGAVVRHVSEREYDGRDLPWATTSGVVDGSVGPHERTTVTEFDPSGSLRRVVKPEGVDEATRRPFVADDAAHEWRLPDAANPNRGASANATKNASVFEYSRDGLRISEHLPWGEDDAQDRRRFRQNFELDGLGRVRSHEAAHEWGGAGGGQEAAKSSYEWFDSGWVRSASDPVLVDPETSAPVYSHRAEYAYELRGLQRRWASSGERGESRSQVRHYHPNGLLRERIAYKREEGGDLLQRRYEYGYNANRSLSEVRELSGQSQTTTDRIAVCRDGLEREVVVDDDAPDGDSTFKRDADGNVIERRTDGDATNFSGCAADGYSGGKKTTFEYDDLGRETRATSQVGTTGAVRETKTGWWPSGELRDRTRPSGVTDEFFYLADGRLGLRERSGAADVTYSYDRNGERTADERGSYTYNARGHLTGWVRSRGERQGMPVSYEVSGTGAVTRKDDGGVVTSYEFLGERLLSEATGGVTRYFDYDDSASGLGLVTAVRTGASVQSFSYDVFERLVSADGPGAGDELSFTYDGLDRRAEVTQAGGTRDLAYVGLSQRPSREVDPAGAGGVSRWVDWDASLEVPYGRLAQASGSESYRSFGLDANGSVERLEPPGGLVAQDEEYLYDPYGRLERREELLPPLPGQPQQDAEGQLSAEARQNKLRFEGFSFEPVAGVYDMHARAYHPSSGRFLSQDRYEDAFADLRLRTDPLTQDRYAFAGGNPVGRVEWDGHYAGNEGGAQRAMRGSRTPRGRRGVTRDERAIPGRSDSTGRAPVTRSGSGDAPLTDAGSTGTGYGRPPAVFSDPFPGQRLAPRADGPAAGSPYANGPPRTGTAFPVHTASRCVTTYQDQCHQWEGPRESTVTDYLALATLPLTGPETLAAKGLGHGLRAAGRSLAPKLAGPARQTLERARGILRGGGAQKPDGVSRMARGSTAVVDKAAELRARAGRNRVSIETPNGRLSVDLAGRSHYEKSLRRYVDTPHVKFEARHIGPGAQVSYTSGPLRQATHADLRVVDRYLSRSGR